MSDNELAELNALCFQAINACNTLDSTIDFEPEFVKVLQFIQDRPALVQQFKQKFLDMVDDQNSVPFELITFCMHTLRWPEIKEAASSRLINSSHIGIKNVMSNVIEAYSDDWEDKILYSYYS